jgi:hypothetical protein
VKYFETSSPRVAFSAIFVGGKFDARAQRAAEQMRLKANRNILQSYLRLYETSPEAIESEMMVLNAQEESLISVIRGLAPEQAGRF